MLNCRKPTTHAALLIALIGCLFVAVTSLANETPGPDSLGDLTQIEFFAQTATTIGTNKLLRMRGADARAQLLVNATFSSGVLRDFTREVTYQASPSGVI